MYFFGLCLYLVGDEPVLSYEPVVQQEREYKTPSMLITYIKLK